MCLQQYIAMYNFHSNETPQPYKMTPFEELKHHITQNIHIC